jgi:glycosyltransferase involved in cell wall biosynthesis
MPAYNRGMYIGEAIESVLAQDFTDFELLLIDDGSTDDTLAVMQRYDDPRIRLERNDGNRGIPWSRNRALELARAPYVAWHDSDDRMAAGRLARQVRYLDRHPDVTMLGGWLRRFDDTGRLRGMQTKPLVHEQLRATLLFRTSHANTTMMARTATLREYGHNLEFAVASDHDLMERLSRQCRFANLPRILAFQREHIGRVTKSSGGRLAEAKYRLIDRQLRALGIVASQADLARHYLLTRIKKEDWASEPHYLEWAADWLHGLLEANRRAGVYSQRALTSVVAQNWLETCARGVRPLGWRKVLSRAGRFPWFGGAGTGVADNLICAAGIRN